LDAESADQFAGDNRRAIISSVGTFVRCASQVPRGR
jgi:hypothetical protein